MSKHDAFSSYNMSKSGDRAEVNAINRMGQEGFNKIYILKNKSNHGVDIIGTGNFDGQPTLQCVEVKYNKSPTSKYQKMGGKDYVADRLTIAMAVDQCSAYSSKNDSSFMLQAVLCGGGKFVEWKKVNMSAPNMAKDLSEIWFQDASSMHPDEIAALFGDSGVDLSNLPEGKWKIIHRIIREMPDGTLKESEWKGGFPAVTDDEEDE